MQLFKRKKRQKDTSAAIEPAPAAVPVPVEAETPSIGPNPTMAELLRFFNVDDISQIAPSGLTAATYYACMVIRCNALSRLPLKVKQKTEDGGAADLRKHTLYNLLHLRPNPFMSVHDMLWATEFQRLHYGNAFWVWTGRGAKFRGLYLLDSTRVQIVVDDAGILSDPNAVYYLYTDGRSGQYIYRSDEIMHFKNFARGGIIGESIRKYLNGVIANEQYAQNVVSNKYKSGLQDPVVVTYTGDLSKEREGKLRRKFEQLGGVKHAGKVIPIPVDFDIKTLQTRLVDSQFEELNKMNARQIATAFGVKSFQLNDLEKSTYSNIEQQNTSFYTDTLLNVITAYEQELDYKLLFDFEREDGVYINFNPDVILRADLLTRYQAYSTGVNNALLKISEVRAKEDLPFVEGTDKLIFGNGAAIPFDDLGKQYTEGGEGNGNREAE